MTLDEARELKAKLKSDIEQLCSEFTAATDINVEVSAECSYSPGLGTNVVTYRAQVDALL